MSGEQEHKNGAHTAAGRTGSEKPGVSAIKKRGGPFMNGPGVQSVSITISGGGIRVSVLVQLLVCVLAPSVSPRQTSSFMA